MADDFPPKWYDRPFDRAEDGSLIPLFGDQENLEASDYKFHKDANGNLTITHIPSGNTYTFNSDGTFSPAALAEGDYTFEQDSSGNLTITHTPSGNSYTFQSDGTFASSAVSTDKVTIKKEHLETALSGYIVPISSGLGVNDAVPISNANPINEVSNLVRTTSPYKGSVLLPSGSIGQQEPFYARSSTKFIGLGRNNTTVNISSSASSLIEVNDPASTAVNCEIRDMDIFGQGPTNHSVTAAVDTNSQTVEQNRFVRLNIGKVQGKAVAEGNSFGQSHFQDVRFNDVDAGNENGMWVCTSSGAPLTVEDLEMYPSDAASGSDSTLFYDDGHDTPMSIEGYLNIGGTAGTIVDRNSRSYTTNAFINYEPSGRNSTPAQLFNLRGHFNFDMSGSLLLQSNTTDLYDVTSGGGFMRLLRPRLPSEVTGTILDVASQNGTIIYEGVSSEVNNSSGGTLSPGVSCLGDQTLVT